MKPWFIFGAACFTLGAMFLLAAYGVGQRDLGIVGFAGVMLAVAGWCAGQGKRRLETEVTFTVRPLGAPAREAARERITFARWRG